MRLHTKTHRSVSPQARTPISACLVRHLIEADPTAALPPAGRWNLASAAVCPLIPVAVPTGDPATAVVGTAGAVPAVSTEDVRADGAAADASSTTAIDWNTRDARGSECSNRVRWKT